MSSHSHTYRVRVLFVSNILDGTRVPSTAHISDENLLESARSALSLVISKKNHSLIILEVKTHEALLGIPMQKKTWAKMTLTKYTRSESRRCIYRGEREFCDRLPTRLKRSCFPLRCASLNEHWSHPSLLHIPLLFFFLSVSLYFLMLPLHPHCFLADSDINH